MHPYIQEKTRETTIKQTRHIRIDRSQLNMVNQSCSVAVQLIKLFSLQMSEFCATQYNIVSIVIK